VPGALDTLRRAGVKVLERFEDVTQ
jgi:hypothetical protein